MIPMTRMVTVTVMEMVAEFLVGTIIQGEIVPTQAEIHPIQAEIHAILAEIHPIQVETQVAIHHLVLFLSHLQERREGLALRNG